jgi:hypothetical protein
VFFWDAALFSFFSEALHCFDGLAKFFEKSVRCQWSQRFSPTVTQDKLFQFRVFFCVDSMIQPSWKAFGNIIFQAFPPSVSDLRPCHSGQEKTGGSSHLFGPFFVLMRHFGMFDFQTFGM